MSSRRCTTATLLVTGTNVTAIVAPIVASSKRNLRGVSKIVGVSTNRATKPISEELPDLMARRGWRPLDVYANGGPAPDATSRYIHRQRGLVSDPQMLRTLRKYEKAFGLPEGYFLEEQLYRLEEEVRHLVRKGLIRVEDLEALVEAARYEERSRRGA